jgi:acetylornithine deacetylase/succinyl-diaminopimelate desuccinylase-like protein
MRKRSLTCRGFRRRTCILAPSEALNDGALVAVLRGTDKSAKSILLLAHIDVVEAKAKTGSAIHSSWLEENGWFLRPRRQ